MRRGLATCERTQTELKRAAWTLSDAYVRGPSRKEARFWKLEEERRGIADTLEPASPATKRFAPDRVDTPDHRAELPVVTRDRLKPTRRLNLKTLENRSQVRWDCSSFAVSKLTPAPVQQRQVFVEHHRQKALVRNAWRTYRIGPAS